MSRDPVERSVEIEQAPLRGFARSIAEVEWLLLALVILYLFMADPAIARSGGMLGVLVGFAVFIIVFRYAPPFAKNTPLKLAIEIAAMLAFLTAVLVPAGGVTSTLVNLYLLPIIVAALALGKRAVAVVVALVCLCYALVGVLTLGLQAAFTPQFGIAAFETLAPFVLVAYATTLLVDNIDTAKNRIRTLSDRDDLTSLYNLRAFTRLAEQEHDVATQRDGRYAVLMIDIEHLKSINDTHGHEAGNRAVKLVAEALVRLTRSTDVVARYGDDQFVVLLVGVDKAIADKIAQRIRNVVFSTTLELETKMVRVKVNVGASAFPENGDDLKAVMTVAERNLAKDKELREPPKGKLIIQKR